MPRMATDAKDRLSASIRVIRGQAPLSAFCLPCPPKARRRRVPFPTHPLLVVRLIKSLTVRHLDAPRFLAFLGNRRGSVAKLTIGCDRGVIPAGKRIHSSVPVRLNVGPTPV